MSRPEKWKDEFIRIAEHACKLGATDQELADMLDVSLRTIHNWRVSKPAFAEVLKTGKDVADERVERSLYQRAVGYEQEEVKIFMPGGAEDPVYAPFRAKIAPDVTAGIFWLKNRRGDSWRDKHDVEHGITSDLAAIIAERRSKVSELNSGNEA
jgi:hypothetical protein